MNEKVRDKLVDAWIAAHHTEGNLSESSENWWAVERVLNWHIEGDAESIWKFILNSYQKEMPDRAFAVLAAGPLEDLLAGHGAEYIDRVETLARRDPKFNRLLGGVWRDSIPTDVWERVERIRNEVW